MICPISVAYTGVRLRVTISMNVTMHTEVNPMHVPAMDANSRDKDTTAGRCALLDDAYTVTYIMRLLHCSTCNYLCCLLFMMHQWFDSNFSVYIYIYICKVYDYMHMHSACAQQPSIHEALVHSSQYLSLDFSKKMFGHPWDRIPAKTALSLFSEFVRSKPETSTFI